MQQSDLQKLTAVGRSDVIPGRTLGVFRLSTYGEAEQEFSRHHLATAATVAAGLPESVGDRLIAAATRDVANGVFRFGGVGFDRQAFSSTHAGFLVWACLRVHDPKITRPQADRLVNPGNEQAVMRAVRECMGYSFDPPAEDDAKKQGQGESPSTGEGSSGDCEATAG